MKTKLHFTQVLSVLLLLLWGGVMLYFYASGRLAKGEYVSKQGWFMTMVLVGGIGCVVVGLFNLATLGAKDGGCCDHDHGHGHDHDGHHHGDCCGHDHSHDHAHKHEHGCCGHDHSHGHHHHEEDEEFPAAHGHGIIEESGLIGRVIAVTILAVPITYAAVYSPDEFKSISTLENKGAYAQSYKKDALASKFELKKSDADSKTVAAAPATQQAAAASKKENVPPVQKSDVSTQPPAATTASSTPPAATAPAPAAGSTPPAPATKADDGAKAKSYGSFTLADLKAQVPQSPEGNFVLEVPELYYTAGDKEVQSVLTGQPVETTAQVIPEKGNTDGKRVRIFRLLIQCCAADARPYSVPVEFEKEAPKFKEMSWVKVVGKMTYRQENGQTVPVLLASKMTETAEPDNKMVY